MTNEILQEAKTPYEYIRMKMLEQDFLSNLASMPEDKDMPHYLYMRGYADAISQIHKWVSEFEEEQQE